MSDPVQLTVRESWRERLRTPAYEYLPSGLPSGYVFGKKPTYPAYVAVKMVSGRIGLFKLLEIHTPRDPRDMHIPRWGFIKYVKAVV